MQWKKKKTKFKNIKTKNIRKNKKTKMILDLQTQYILQSVILWKHEGPMQGEKRKRNLKSKKKIFSKKFKFGNVLHIASSGQAAGLFVRHTGYRARLEFRARLAHVPQHPAARPRSWLLVFRIYALKMD